MTLELKAWRDARKAANAEIDGVAAAIRGKAKMTQIIKAVYGPEPMREGENPSCEIVGHGGVTRIERREDNLGTYGIAWFHVFKGELLVKSYNALHVAEVIYMEPQK